MSLISECQNFANWHIFWNIFFHQINLFPAIDHQEGERLAILWMIQMDGLRIDVPGNECIFKTQNNHS